MSKGYDSRCYDLGRIFLGDEPELLTDENADELAQDIQCAIDDFMSYKLSKATEVNEGPKQ